MDPFRAIYGERAPEFSGSGNGTGVGWGTQCGWGNREGGGNGNENLTWLFEYSGAADRDGCGEGLGYCERGDSYGTSKGLIFCSYFGHGSGVGRGDKYGYGVDRLDDQYEMR